MNIKRVILLSTLAFSISVLNAAPLQKLPLKDNSGKFELLFTSIDSIQKQNSIIIDSLEQLTNKIEGIWAMTPGNFMAWRKKYDFPRILSYFSQHLTRFEDWKAEYQFTDEMLMNFGISNCINPNPAKDKRKFIVERTWEKEVIKMISYQNVDGKFYNMGPNPVNHKVISSFLGYIDWCNAKGIKIIEGWKNNDLLFGPSSSHPMGEPKEIQISILTGLELLKIGGIDVKINPYEGVKPRYFEFVNASHLKLEGRMGQQLTFENSFIDNLVCDKLDFPLVEFRNSSVLNIYCTDSSLKQWSFAYSNVTGKVSNSELRMVFINGGLFNVDFKDCTIDNVNARQGYDKDLFFENTYRTLKKLYADQGDDKKAIEYFLLEREVERERMRKLILQYPYRGLFNESKTTVWKKQAVHSSIYILKFIASWINNFYWGYGRKPFRIIRNSSLLILLFAGIYYLAQSSMHMPEDTARMTITDSIYYSTVTFTTLGYGDFFPLGSLRIVAAIEAFLGGISLGFFVAGFSNFKY